MLVYSKLYPQNRPPLKLKQWFFRPPYSKIPKTFPSHGYEDDENYIGREHCNDGASDGTDLLRVH